MTEQDNIKLKKKRKDLLNKEVKFRQAAYDQIKQQKLLASSTLNYWNEANKMESKITHPFPPPTLLLLLLHKSLSPSDA